MKANMGGVYGSAVQISSMFQSVVPAEGTKMFCHLFFTPTKPYGVKP